MVGDDPVMTGDAAIASAALPGVAGRRLTTRQESLISP